MHRSSNKRGCQAYVSLDENLGWYSFLNYDEKKHMAIKDIIKRVFHPHAGADENKRWQSREYRREQHGGRPLEGAGRGGWDYEQNRGYGNTFGNVSGPSSYIERGELKHFRGRGPKNYHRSDERIQEDINDFLTDDRFLDATHIEVKVESGEVVLSGEVEDREAKRRAEEIAEAVLGVKHLENRLRISKR